MLLSEEVSRELVELNIDLIICCIDHWEKKKYENIRIGGKFETVIKNVEKLLELKNNVKSSKSLIVIKSLDFGFKNKERVEFTDFWSSRGGIPLIGWIDSWAGQMPDLRKVKYQTQPYFESERVSCADLWFKMVINWKGDVVLCCHNFDYSISFGNIIENEIHSIWHGDKLIKYRQKHIESQFNCNALCRGCTEWGTLGEMDIYTELNEENFSLIF